MRSDDAAAYRALTQVVGLEQTADLVTCPVGAETIEHELEAAFRATKGAGIVKGFAIGRTIFNDAAEKWLSGAIDDKAAVDDMASRFRRLTEAWKRARS